MKQRHHTPEQVIRKLAEGDKLLAEGQRGAVVVVEAAHEFLRAPGGKDLTLGSASVEQLHWSLAAVVVEAFVGHREKPPGPIGRITVTPAVSFALVLHPTSTLVKFQVGQLDDVKRIQALGVAPLRPDTTSRSCPRLTSTICVQQFCRR
jgi:hypothetical protein